MNIQAISPWLNDDVLTEAVQVMIGIRESGDFVSLHNPVPVGNSGAYLKFGAYGFINLCSRREDGYHYPICYKLFMLDPLSGWFLPKDVVDLFKDRQWGEGVRDAFKRGLVIEQGPGEGAWTIGRKEDMNLA